MIGQMLQPADTMQNLYGFTFFLVIVHALHVGGVAGLALLLLGIRRQAYDHERHFPVRFCALYWHSGRSLDHHAGVLCAGRLCFQVTADVTHGGVGFCRDGLSG